MEFIKKNLKLIGVFNTLLIILDIVLEGRDLFIDVSIATKIVTILTITGLIFALMYITYGYKKDGAKFYKMFMYSYAFLSIYDAILNIFGIFVSINKSIMISDIVNIVLALTKLIPVYCVLSLAFSKDLGKDKSFNLCFINFGVAALCLLIKALTNSGAYFGYVILAFNTILFVMGKYADKQARGRKI